METIDVRSNIIKEIESKYVIPVSTGYNTRTNIVMDAFYPRKLINELHDISFNYEASSRDVAINPFIAKEIGVRTMHISEMCRILGYSNENISRLLANVKRKNIQITLVGFGGTGANFIHWCEQLLDMTYKEYLFDKIIAYDADSWAISNIPRIPLAVEEAEKVLSLTSRFRVSRAIEKNLSNLEESVLTTHAFENTIYYGAPDIATRKMLSESESIFVSATHKGNEASLDLNPLQSSNLQTETYGKIDLSTFFMNHLHMTIRFLEFLASEDLDSESIRTESRKICDVEFIPGEYKTKNRTYKFPRGEEND